MSSTVGCCFNINICVSPDYYRDGICDDENNNQECNWDGGDCCGDNVNTDYCMHCDCLDGDVKICNAENPCGHYEGDCNSDNECQPGLKCGTENCPAFLGYDSSVDCCFNCSCMMVEVFYATETQEYTFLPEIFGCYMKSSEKVNGRNYYTSIAYDGELGIWWEKSLNIWMIGSAKDKGTLKGLGYNNKNVECLPEHIDWNWVLYHNSNGGEWKQVGKGLEVKCGISDGSTNGNFGFCSACNLCGENEGDCNNDIECQDGFTCGTDNCPSSLDFDSSIDCCNNRSSLINGDLGFCTTSYPCGENEGDCNYDNQCLNGLICGQDNCPTSLGFDLKVDCCRKPVKGEKYFCSVHDPCEEGEGNCDHDNECQNNLKCGYCPVSLGFDSSIDCCYNECHIFGKIGESTGNLSKIFSILYFILLQKSPHL